MINQMSFPVPAIRAVRVPLALFTKTTPGHRRIFTPSINNSFATEEKSLFRNSCSISLRVSRGILKLFVIVSDIRILPYYNAYTMILVFCNSRCAGETSPGSIIADHCRREEGCSGRLSNLLFLGVLYCDQEDDR